jgi:hypothetical protein
MAASGEPAVAIKVAMSGGFAVLESCDGRYAWPGEGRFWEALDENDEAAESIDGLRTGALGRGVVSGRFGREGGGMVTGDAGGDMPADDSVGDDACRSLAYTDGRVGWLKLLKGAPGGVGGCAGLVGRMGEVCCSSSASSASSFSLGLRGSSRRGSS